VISDDMVDGSRKLFENGACLPEFFPVMFITPFDQVAKLKQKIYIVIFAVFKKDSKLCAC